MKHHRASHSGREMTIANVMSHSSIANLLAITSVHWHCAITCLRKEAESWEPTWIPVGEHIKPAVWQL